MKLLQWIAKAAIWIPKEVGKLFGELPKLITLTEDARQIATDAIPKLLQLLDAVRQLVQATIEDGGQFLKALAELGVAIAAAAGDKALNIREDSAVVTAFDALIGCFQRSNVSDVIAAWHALVTVTQAFDATIEGDLKKLQLDAAK